MLKRILFIAILTGAGICIQAQEFQARLTVNTQQISTTVDKKIFNTLQTALTNFINSRKWSSDVFSPQERIQCNFLLNLEKELGNNTYKGTLTVQAARPIYNTTYDSPIMNFIDDDVVFRYQEFMENKVYFRKGEDELFS